MGDTLQKTVLAIGTAGMVVMGLFPPWFFDRPFSDGVAKLEAGYHFLFTAPVKGQLVGSIDIERLVVQWVVLLILIVGCILVSRPSK